MTHARQIVQAKTVPIKPVGGQPFTAGTNTHTETQTGYTEAHTADTAHLAHTDATRAQTRAQNAATAHHSATRTTSRLSRPPQRPDTRLTATNTTRSAISAPFFTPFQPFTPSLRLNRKTTNTPINPQTPHNFTHPIGDHSLDDDGMGRGNFGQPFPRAFTPPNSLAFCGCFPRGPVALLSLLSVAYFFGPFGKKTRRNGAEFGVISTDFSPLFGGKTPHFSSIGCNDRQRGSHDARRG